MEVEKEVEREVGTETYLPLELAELGVMQLLDRQQLTIAMSSA